LDFGQANLTNNATSVSLTLNVNEQFPAHGAKVLVINIPDKTAREAFLSKVTMSTNNTFAGMKLDQDGYLVMQDTTSSAISGFALDKKTAEQVSGLLPENTTLKQDIGSGTDPKTALQKLTNTQATEAIPASVDRGVAAVLHQVDSRVNANVVYGLPSSAPVLDDGDSPKQQALKAPDAGMGVAAGDASERFGFWGNALGGIAKQSSRKGDAGFKSNIAGGIVGIDTMLNDRAIVGFAVSNVLGNVKI
jgi:outer membrane autotransporter protein